MPLRNLIKITKVRKASNYEPKWRFKAECLSPAISARLWCDSRLRHMLSESQDGKLSDFPIIL